MEGNAPQWLGLEATLNLALDRDKPVPLARQIQAHFERLIREGRLVGGMKLPATRELARDVGVNRATVALAYEELIAAGLARAHVGQGTFVSPGVVSASSAERATRAAATNGRDAVNGSAGAARGSIDWAALLSRHAQIIAEDEERSSAFASGPLPAGTISFAGGMPDSGLFPTDAFRRVLNQVVRDDGETLLQYYPARGYEPLRRYLATYLVRFGVEARAEEILVVNGSQQGFDLIARTFVDAGDMVAIEQPTYPRAAQVFRAFGAQLLGVPWDGDGPRADAFERLLARHAPKLFYCQPTGHNPTGLTLNGERAQRLLAVAAAHQVPIVEDGFDASLSYGARAATPLKARDTDAVVVYIGTFSKILFPGLRLGWIIAPVPVIERLEAAKRLADLHTSALIQAAVHRFCAMRFLDRHVARAATEYRKRRDVLLAALRRRMPSGVTWTEPLGGFSLLLTLPDGMDAAVLLRHAVEHGVAFTPGAAFCVDGSGERSLRLSFSAVPAARIDEGVRRLADAVKGQQKRPRRPVDRAAVPLV